MKRILIGVGEVASYGRNMRSGMRQLGHKCDFLDLNRHPFYVPSDDLKIARYCRTVRSVRLNSAHRIVWFAPEIALRFLALLISSIRYSVFIYLATGAIFHRFELIFLKLLGKKTIRVFLGSDSRPIYLNGRDIIEYHDANDTAGIFESVRRQKRLIGFVDRWSNLVVDHPPSGVLHERGFVKFNWIGIPCVVRQPSLSDVAGLQNTSGVTEHLPITILHAPSSETGKGSKTIRQIVERLSSSQFDVAYVELSGVPHDQVQDAFKSTNILLDEVNSDTKCGVLGLEAAAAGVWVINAGSYSACFEIDHAGIPTPPTEYCLPDDLEKVLSERVRSCRESVCARDHRAQEFAITQWAASACAERLLAALDGHTPHEAFYDPRRGDSVVPYGAFALSDQYRRFLRTLLEQPGARVRLGLGHAEAVFERLSWKVQ